MNYTSLKIVKKLSFAFIYYPNGSSLGFTISKGYFSADQSTGLFQIVEDGKSKRPAVLLSNITVQDESTGGSVESFTTLQQLTNRLAILQCPLINLSSSGTGGGVTKTSQLINDGDDGDNPFIALPDVTQVKSDWNATSGPEEILNKPPIPTQTNQLANNGADGVNPFISLNNIQQYKSANFTAQNDVYYILGGTTITVTDPTPVIGKGFIVYGSQYSMVVGGVTYSPQCLIYRYYVLGGWISKDMSNTQDIIDIYSALATKQNMLTYVPIKTVIRDTTAFTALTGTLTETLMGTYFIPANTFGANDILRIPTFTAEKTGIIGTVTMRVKIGPTNVFGSSNTLATYTTSAVEVWCIMQRSSFTLRGGNIRGLQATIPRQTDIVATSGIISVQTFNPAVDNYIFTSLQLSNIADSVFQSNFLVTN